MITLLPKAANADSSARRHVFMVNPASGSEKGVRIAKAIVPALAGMGLSASAYVIQMTTLPPDYAALRRLIAGDCALVAVGGDGTVNDLVRAALEAGSDCALGVIPVGTGNDLARVTGTHALLARHGLEAVLRALLQGRTRPLDVWRAGDRLFTNYLSVGLDAAVTADFHVRRQLGLFPTGSVTGNKAAYALCALKGLSRRIHGSRAELSLADGSLLQLDLQGCTSFILANIPSYGGGALSACDIRQNDGLLQATIIRSPMSLAGMFLVQHLLPWHRSAYAAKLECLAVRKVILHLGQDEFLQMDGESCSELVGRSLCVEKAGSVRLLHT